MANFNKVILIGRLTRDPASTPFKSGGMVAKFGFAVTNRKKNPQNGQWEDDPMFIDVEVFNRGETATGEFYVQVVVSAARQFRGSNNAEVEALVTAELARLFPAADIAAIRRVRSGLASGSVQPRISEMLAEIFAPSNHAKDIR